jgi:hypothetical protein
LSEQPQNIFVRYIPFLNWENRAAKTVEEHTPVKQHPAPVKIVEKEEHIEQLEPSLDRNERLLSDEFLGDTFVSVWEKGFYDRWLSFKKQGDSLALDSLMKKPMNPGNKEKSRKLLVEYWASPFQYKGYLFMENKLVVYGLPYPGKVFVYRNRDTAVAVLPNGQFPLIEKDKFTSF